MQYLEGLRGLAAMQVVAMHFVTGFLPAVEQNAWPPLRLLFDGHTAVYVFFLISGAVLTPSFGRPGSNLAKIGKRIVRLGLPVAAAAAVALVLLALMPDAHRRAAELSGSAWLATDSSGAPTFAHFIREVSLDSIMLGYRDSTLLWPLADHLPLMENSLDAPFWSLHLEFYGSLLILALVWLRTRSRWLHRASIVAAALTFGAHPMFLFVLGHLSAPLLHRSRSVGAAALGAVLVILGIALCATKDWRVVEALRIVLSNHALAFAPSLFQFQSQLGASALYFGTLLCPLAWPLLESSPFRHLGRLSFSIYLLHFPIMFTIVCVVFIGISSLLPYSVLMVGLFGLFVLLTLVAARVFERYVDGPAVALSRRLEPSVPDHSRSDRLRVGRSR